MTLANADSAGFFDAAKEGRLVFQKCSHCGSVQYPPRHHCADCWEADLDWVDSSGKGVIETLTVVRRAPLADFAEDVPYVIASVMVEEGPRMITNLTGGDALDAQIGDPVTVTFQPSKKGDVLPVFQRA